MDSAVLTTLEFDKMRAKLADIVGSVIGREIVGALTPSNDFAEVKRRLEETNEALNILLSVPSVPLGGIRDVRAMVKRASLGASLEPNDFMAIGSTLYAARRMKGFFNELAIETVELARLVDRIILHRNLENNIELSISEQGALRDTASSELARLRRDIKISQQRVKDKLESILHSSEYNKYFQDALVTIRSDRYVIPVKQEYRHNFPGIVHDQSASGATVFIEPMAVVNLNNDLKQMMSAEQAEIERILQRLSALVAAEAESLLEACQVLGELDFAFAKARLALLNKAVMPVLNSSGIVDLKQARHPLIKAENVIPIDVRIGREFIILVITGPNTGGKTVSLKTVGLFALMAQAGLFIPAASGSTLPVFANIYSDIGDEQSIEQSLSTFSAHMTNLVRILQRIGPKDLLLIDEIGAGTDPDEGAALAMSILEHLHNIGVRTIATTHYSELKTFAYNRHGIENASVEFDINTLRPTYRLLIGLPGSSKAFFISKRLGLSDVIINRAQELVDEDYAEFDKVITSLEEQKKLYLEREQEVNELQRKLEELQSSLTEEQEKFLNKKNELLGKARDEAAQLLRQTKREAEDIIEQLKAQFSVNSERERQKAIQNARSRLTDSFSGARGGAEGGSVQGRPVTHGMLSPGSMVYIASLGQKGIVQSVSGDDALVQLGIMKMNVPLANCRLLEESAGQSVSKSKTGTMLSKTSEISRQIDIRGTNIEEAETILDKYLDDAVLAGLGEVIIIHGKGTGALRKGIRVYLKAHRNVKEIQIGEVNQGGDGATVVKLK